MWYDSLQLSVVGFRAMLLKFASGTMLCVAEAQIHRRESLARTASDFSSRSSAIQIKEPASFAEPSRARAR